MADLTTELFPQTTPDAGDASTRALTLGNFWTDVTGAVKDQLSQAQQDLTKTAAQKASDWFHGLINKVENTQSGSTVVNQVTRDKIIAALKNPRTWLVVGGFAFAIFWLGRRSK